MPLKAHSLALVTAQFEWVILPALAPKLKLVEAPQLMSVGWEGCLLMSVWQSQAVLQQAEANPSLQGHLQHLSIYFDRQPLVVTGEVSSPCCEPTGINGH